MRAAITHVISFIFLILVGANEESDEIHYTNSWAVHVDKDDLDSVNELARKHGFTNLGQIGSLPGYFHFMKESIKEKSKRSLDDHTELLLAEPIVKWVKQQRVLERSKRNIFPEHEDTERRKRDMAVTVQDPFYKDQWYLQNIGQSSGPSGLDINVLPAWGQGYSGKGVVVSILDDGVDPTHPDLKKNYDPLASFDFNDFDPDPKPRSSDPRNCHGTKCAGEVAAEANNGICGVGVSFNASIGGIRMLDGKPTDTIEGSSLSYHSDYIDIYTCCWGPTDDGKRFGKPGFLASKALKIGAEKGRGGKGNIFVWATGNGGLTDDDCNCDGYTTSIYTVSIGAISDHGLSTYYTETCASTLAVTFSGASHREAEENKIVTTGLNHECTKSFKGTSSAAPLASGMLALVLEANPNLTWRDVQHIIVETTQKTSPLDEGWKINGAGKEYNHKFGFGKLDAMRMVEKAKSWENVPKQRVCYGKEHETPRNIPSSGSVVVSSNTSSCAGTTSEIHKLEHVQVKISLDHRHRGHLSITLISPSGTRSELLKTRRNDHSAEGLTDWLFMSVHFWGEDPKGSWTLVVTDNDRNTHEHHVTKAKQGDFEDVTRVVMDDTEKQGPWDADRINEYESTEQAPSRNYTSQDHILKGMENTVGELVKGNKFIELAKRKKDRKHSTKGIVGRNSKHAWYKHKTKHRAKKKHKNWTKKKTTNKYKTETKPEQKDLEKNDRKMKRKHQYLKHKGHKHHKHRLKKKHQHRKEKEQDESGGKYLMAEGSLKIPKSRTPLEAKIAIQAFMEPYFKVSASRIVLPKRYQSFMGEVDIKMKLVKERRMRQGGNEMGNQETQLGSAKETGVSKAQSQQMNFSSIAPEVSELVKQKSEVKKVMADIGSKPFRIPSNEMNVLEAARQNTELEKAPGKRPGESLGGKYTNDDNVYINLLNAIKSLPQNKVVDSSLNHLDERIDILTDAKPYTNDNNTNMLKHSSYKTRNNTTGSDFTGSVYTGNNVTRSKLIASNATASEVTEIIATESRGTSTGSNFTGSNATRSVYTGNNVTRSESIASNAIASAVTEAIASTSGSEFTGRNATGSEFTGSTHDVNSSFAKGFIGANSREKNASGNHLQEDIGSGTTNHASSTTDTSNKTVRPDDVPIILYDPVKNQFAEVKRINASDPSISVVTGNEATGNGSKITGNGSQGEAVEDEGEEVSGESSGLGGSSGAVINEDKVCAEGKVNDLGITCQVTEQDSKGLVRQSTEELNNAAEEPNDDDDDDDDSTDGNHNNHVTEEVLNIPQLQGSHEVSKNSPTAKLEPPSDEDKLAFLLSTGKYQGFPEGTLKQGPIQPKELRPLNVSDVKNQDVPSRSNISKGIMQNEESKTIPSSVKHQTLPGTPLKKGLSQPEEKRPLQLKDQDVPDRFVEQDIGPTPSNQDLKMDVSELDPLDQLGNRDLKELENALEKQVAQLEKYRDDSPTGSRFLQRVKDDIRHRNVDDLRFLEDEIRNDMRDAFSRRESKQMVDSDGDGILTRQEEDSNDNDDDDREEDGEEFHRLEKRRLSKSDSKLEIVHHIKNSRESDKYGKGNSGVLKSWTLILYGT